MNNIKKFLPINQNTRFRSYTYYSFMQAIADNKYHTGDIAAVVNLFNKEVDWCCQSNNLKIRREKDYFIFHTNEFCLDMNGIVYRKLDLNDAQDITLSYQQYSNPWGKLGFYISDYVPTEDHSETEFEFGSYCREEFYYIDKNGQLYFHKKNFRNNQIHLEKNGCNLCFTVKDNEQHIIFSREYTSNKASELYLCVYVQLQNNVYYDWLFQNNVQLKYNLASDSLRLEFDVAIKRDWKYFTTNYFINYNIEKISFLNKIGIDILTYIKNKLGDGIYLEIDLDSIDINNTRRECKLFCVNPLDQ